MAMRRDDVLVPLSVIVLGVSLLSGLLTVTDRFVGLEARLTRLETTLLRVEKTLDREHPHAPGRKEKN